MYTASFLPECGATLLLSCTIASASSTSHPASTSALSPQSCDPPPNSSASITCKGSQIPASSSASNRAETGASIKGFVGGTVSGVTKLLVGHPFDTIKVDESFVRQMAGGRPVILRSIVKMAHELGMEIVAEGAESESEAIELYQLGCEYAQGPVFGEPMSTLQARQLVGAAPAAA